jgi:DnaJ-class molecular chaperone
MDRGMSYLAGRIRGWNSIRPLNNSDAEQICKRCRGTGEDEDGADCVFCEGWGSTISVFR